MPLLRPATPTPVLIDRSTSLVGTGQAAAALCNGKDQVVVIVDTGVDDTLPILQGRVLSGSSTGDPQPDGSLGWKQGECLGSKYGRPLDSGFGHGSQVASVVTCNDVRTSGVAPEARLVSIRVTDASGMASAGEVAKALEETYLHWTECHTVASVCLSLAMADATFTSESACAAEPMGAAIGAAVANLYTAGIPVVSGSGNDWTWNALSLPACLPNVVSVGATEIDDTFANYSNAADFLDLLAPGDGLRATNADGSVMSLGSGTSMAGPHVAAAIAVLRQFRPHDKFPVLLDALKTTGRDVEVHYNTDKPRINVYEALQKLAGGNTPQCGG